MSTDGARRALAGRGCRCDVPRAGRDRADPGAGRTAVVRRHRKHADQLGRGCCRSAGIDHTLLDRLSEMSAHQSLARGVTPGAALVHWDARADNVLIRDGRAVLLDWAWASRGAPWLDTLLLAMDFRIQGGPDADVFLRASATTRDVDPEHLRRSSRAWWASGPSVPVVRRHPVCRRSARGRRTAATTHCDGWTTGPCGADQSSLRPDCRPAVLGRAASRCARWGRTPRRRPGGAGEGRHRRLHPGFRRPAHDAR